VKSATTNLAKNIDGSPTTDRFRSEWYDKLADLLPILQGLNLDEDPRLDAIAKRCQALLHPAGPDEYKLSMGSRAQAYTKAQSIYDDLSAIYGSKGGNK
jgi:hypothetical protein